MERKTRREKMRMEMEENILYYQVHMGQGCTHTERKVILHVGPVLLTPTEQNYI